MVNEPQRVLVVEDDRATRAQLSFLLRKESYIVHAAKDGDEGWRMYREMSPPLVLTDWSMPGLSGPELCKRIRREPSELYTYIVMLTGRGEAANIEHGLEAGADDYVKKPFDIRELLARLRTGTRFIALQQQNLEVMRQLREQSRRDGLTGALNRRAIDERLNEALQFVRRRTRELSVALFDLDHFKQVNDSFGHQAGDEVLRESVRRVSDVIREYDAVGRYGGEEFLMVLPDCPAEEAAAIAERVRAAIAAEPVVTPEGLTVHATASVGLASAEPGYRGRVEDLVEAADAALYRAKRGGRNRVEYARGPGFVVSPTARSSA